MVAYAYAKVNLAEAKRRFQAMEDGPIVGIGEMTERPREVMNGVMKEAKFAESFEESAFVRGMVRLCLDGWKLGWHERNAGNVSYRLSESERSNVLACGAENAGGQNEWASLDAEYPALEGECLAVTASGSYFRNADMNPESAIGVVQFGERGGSYRVVAGFEGGFRPTSELAAHVAVHDMFLREAPAKRVLYHAHTPAATCITSVLNPDTVTITRALWSIMIECAMFFPRGIGVVPPMVPGTKRLADETVELLKSHDLVLWSHHGMICPGENFDDAFGLMHVAEKAAQIWSNAAAAAGSSGNIKGVPLSVLKEIAGPDATGRFLS